MHEVVEGKITMSTGVVFRVLDIPLMVIDSINKKAREGKPKVPVQHIEDKCREEENPNDPDYIKALQDWEVELNEKIIDATLILGVELDKLPGGFPKPKDKSWSDKLKKIDIEIPGDRFLTWIKCCAAPTVEDMNSLILACSRNIGVTEEDLADAANLFRDSKERSTDRDISDKA